MNKLVIYLSTFGAGCAVGILGTKTYFEKKYRDISEQEIESVKEIYKRKASKNETLEKNSDEPAEHEESRIGSSVIFKNLTPENMQSMAINYHTLSKGFEEHPIEENYKPYFITIDDFDEVNDGYSKHDFSFYVEDSTLVNNGDIGDTTEEEIIMNASDTIGIDNLDIFENMNEDVCYIRNEFLGADYEVTKVFSSYSAIMGDDY